MLSQGIMINEACNVMVNYEKHPIHFFYFWYRKAFDLGILVSTLLRITFYQPSPCDKFKSPIIGNTTDKNLAYRSKIIDTLWGVL